MLQTVALELNKTVILSEGASLQGHLLSEENQDQIRHLKSKVLKLEALRDRIR